MYKKMQQSTTLYLIIYRAFALLQSYRFSITSGSSTAVSVSSFAASLGFHATIKRTVAHVT